MKTGNDIVALEDLSWRVRSVNARYLNKICTPSEQAMIRNASQPVHAIAACWAIKESAYKIYHQMTRHRYFAPLDFNVLVSPEIYNKQIEVSNLQVQTPIGLLQTRLEKYERYIHAVTQEFSFQHHFNLITDTFHVPFSSLNDQSCFLKSQLLKKLSQFRVYQNHSLQIVHDSDGIPRISYGNNFLPISLSISHDGIWGGYSMLLPYVWGQ